MYPSLILKNQIMKSKTNPKKTMRMIADLTTTGRLNFGLTKRIHLVILLAFVVFTSCKKNLTEQAAHINSKTSDNSVTAKPNIIIFMADDFGYELPTFTGGQS